MSFRGKLLTGCLQAAVVGRTEVSLNRKVKRPGLAPLRSKTMLKKSLRAEKKKIMTGCTDAAQRNRKGIALFSKSQNNTPYAASASQESGETISCREIQASMTVEASLVLPLFLFFIMNVIFLLDVIRLQSNVTAALQQTGDKICEYAWYREYAAGGEGDGSSGGIEVPQQAGEILSLAYAAGEIRHYLGSGYMNSTCLRGGSGGISCLQSRILSGNDIVEIHADYRTRPFIPVLNGPDFAVRCTYYGHAWTGYEIGSGTGGDGEGQEQEEGRHVIVAENGVVYHTDPDCVYLKPRIREADASDLSHLRASDGSIYYPCEYCHPSREGKVYITPDGNRYHSTDSCSRLTRTTHEENVQEAEGHLHPCPKCGGKHE